MEIKPKLEIQAKKYKEESAIFSARFPKDLIKKIDEIAQETGRTRNEIMTMCLEFAIENIIINKEDNK